MLYHQEELKARHKKHGAYMKDQRTGMLNELLIPQPSNNNPDAHMKVTNEKDIKMILLRRNARKLTEANISPFSTRPLATIIDPSLKEHSTTTLLIPWILNTRRNSN